MKKLLAMFSFLVMFSILITNGANAACSCGCPKTNCNDVPKCEHCRELSENSCKCYYDKKMEEFFCRLNLDNCQLKEANCLKDKYKADFKAIKTKMMNDKKCLCNLLDAPCLDKKAIRAQEKTLRADFKDMKKHFKCFDKELKPILNKCQTKERRKLNREMKYRIKKEMKYCCKKH